MALPDIEAVEEDEEYIYLRFRDPGEFDEIRTPDWAEDTASSVSDGADVHTGKEEDGDEWDVRSVLVDSPVDGETAGKQATELAENIE